MGSSGLNVGMSLSLRAALGYGRGQYQSRYLGIFLLLLMTADVLFGLTCFQALKWRVGGDRPGDEAVLVCM